MAWGVRVVVLAAAVILAGCAGQPEIPYDASSAGTIRSIGVLTPDMPDHPTARLATTVGQSFGLVGALVDAGMQDNRDKHLWGVMIDANFLPRTAFPADMIAALEAKGFSAKLIPTMRKSAGYLRTYPAPADANVDAYLDLSFIGDGYGYLSSGIGAATPYRPFVYLNCKLVRASDGAVLMQDTILYDPIAQTDKTVTVSPDPAYAFETFDMLEASPRKAVEGEDVAFHQVAKTIAGLIH